jgi:hypothetical protein
MGAPMGGGFGGPPPGFGGPVGPGGPPPPDLQGQLSTWFVISIISILFSGCCVLGIVATVMMNGAKTAYAQGNYLEAQSKLGTAKILCIIGFVLLGLSLIGNVLAAIANG